MNIRIPTTHLRSRTFHPRFPARIYCQVMIIRTKDDDTFTYNKVLVFVYHRQRPYAISEDDENLTSPPCSANHFTLSRASFSCYDSTRSALSKTHTKADINAQSILLSVNDRATSVWNGSAKAKQKKKPTM